MTKKTTVRKRKRTKRTEETKAAETAAPTEKPATEAPAASVAADDEAPAETPTRGPSAPRTKKTKRRSRKKKAAAATTEAVTPASTESEAEPAKPADKKSTKTRKRRLKKSRRASKTHDEQPPAAAAAAEPAKTVSPSAEIEQSGDTIVIRFPSAEPSADARPDAPPADRPPEAAAPASADQADTNSSVVEPPIDWEETEAPAGEPETAAASAVAIEDAEAPPADRDQSAPETPSGGEAAETPRPKRRRRRKKKAHRPAPEQEAPAAEPADAEEDRQRPEPAAEPAEHAAKHAEPPAGEKPARRRRRRSRRGRKPAPAEAPVEDEAESEELAKAPAPAGQKEMIINVVPHEECRIAIMENGKLQEIYLERASAENYVGNIYKGVVTNVEPSIQAAFIDFGQGKNGFLHISDLHPQYFPDGEGHTEDVGRKMPRRSRPPIQRCLRRKQELLVQITKEGIGTKGPTLTTYLSIPGRFLVMMPGMRQLGVSRKIEDEDIRRKLRGQLGELDLPDNIGFIARTAAVDHTKRELQSDLNYLTRLWKAVTKRIKSQKAPAELYTESDLVIRTIRDVYTSDIHRILIDHHDVAERANEFLSIFSPRSRDTVVEYRDPAPIFHRYGIESELERLHSRHVPLKSGGSLVIDSTEALVAIDVNSGRFRTEEDAETTAYKINLEAADEIPRQLRLRDLGGVVVCDFIDMRQEKHKREIERRLNRNLKEHKERAKILRMSEFGLIELTRQRQRASLTRSVYQDCRFCHGSGLVKTPESVALDVMRLIQLAVTRENIRSIEVSVSPEVGHLLQNRKRAQLHALELENHRSISIRTDPVFGLDQIQMQYCDPRGRVVPHP